MDHSKQVSKGNNRIALVLQGGGALGAYQAGVYQALHEHDLAPDWVVGTSIGAINAAIIAGDKPLQRVARLKEFWDEVATDDLIDLRKVPDMTRRLNVWLTTMDSMLRGVKGFFTPRRFSLFGSAIPIDPEKASFYDTAELAETLARLVDFKHLTSEEAMRLTVSAVQVTSGALTNFDSRHQALNLKHVMASGALPPGFPPIRIDGQLYWDGGLFSNTPLEIVLDEEPRVNTLCFMVDLWSATGPEPQTLDQVQTRQKDVIYASRSKSHIDDYMRIHNLRRNVRALYDALPPEAKSAAAVREMSAFGCDTTMHIVRLPYAGRDWNMASKDVNFSRGSIEWRWDQGYGDATRAIQQAAWLRPVAPHVGVVVHDLAPNMAPTMTPTVTPLPAQKSTAAAPGGNRKRTAKSGS